MNKPALSDTSLQYGGTGFGLAICKNLVELMGGSIAVESAKGCGSVFCFEVQCEKVSLQSLDGDSLRRDMPEELCQAAATVVLKDKVVLIVEDNKILQKFLLSYLEPLLCRCFVANDGVEALEMHEKQDFHLMLMDLEMPRMKGTEATRVIRDRERVSGKRVVIIGVSANAMGSDLVVAQNSGMDAYLTKPFYKGELYETISKYDMLTQQPVCVVEEVSVAVGISQKLTLFSRKATSSCEHE
jgi:CheY-like chemotaxis protein